MGKGKKQQYEFCYSGEMLAEWGSEPSYTNKVEATDLEEAKKKMRYVIGPKAVKIETVYWIKKNGKTLKSKSWY